MKPADYPEPFRSLARELRRLPGIGPRSAERITLWLASSRDAKPRELADALHGIADHLRSCRICGFFATEELCEICRDESRLGGEICVVEQATDVLPLERTGFFRGRFHVLGGRIGELTARLSSEKPREIILALSADVEGEATTNYVAEILASTGIPLTRIAHGLPAGGGLEHADPLTLQRALAGRNPLGKPASALKG